MPVTLRPARPATLHLGCRPPKAALTRRRLLGASAACLALHATGCRSDPSESALQRKGRQVETDKGTITVPHRAERVVCADFYGAFAVVDLGLTPVGAAGEGYANTGDRYAPPLAEVPSVGDFTEPDLEKVATQRPDLILRTIDTDDKLYEQLQAIAPTAVISFQQLSLTEVAVRVGDVLGRPDEATDLEEQYRELCDRIRTDHAAVLAEHRATYVAMADQVTFWTFGPAWTDTTVLIDCGVTLAPPSADQSGPTADHSLEELSILAESDLLFINAEVDGKTPAADTKPLTSSSIWKQLPAVRAKRVFAIPYGAASLGTGIELAERLDAALGEITA